MYKIKSRSRKNIIGITFSGKLSASAYRELTPLLEKKIKEFGKIRLLIELDHWDGWEPFASFRDIAFVFKNSFKIDRVAFVCDSKSDRSAVLVDQPFHPWFRTNTRYFSGKEEDVAWNWIEEGIVEEGEGITDLSQQVKKVRYGTKLSVLIIGGGATGMTVGAMMKKRGFEPTILEANEHRVYRDMPLAIWPSAGGVLKSMGLFKKLMRMGSCTRRKLIYKDSGEQIENYAFDRMIEQYGDLLWVPYEGYVELMGSKMKDEMVHKGLAVTRLERGKRRIRAHFSDGSFSKFDLVICCDGVHSKMRELVFGKGKLTNTGILGWNFAIANEFAEAIQDVEEYWSKDAYIKLIPIGDRVYCSAGTRYKEGHKATGGSAEKVLKEVFGGFKGRVPEVLKKFKGGERVWHDWHYTVEPGAWVEEGVVMLGDVANIYLPMMELNRTLAIEGTHVLVDEIARSDSMFINNALESYAKRRQKRIAGLNELLKEDRLDRFSVPESFKGDFNMEGGIVNREDFINFWLGALDMTL